MRAIIMEVVEGEVLSRRIVRGALPLDQALPIARQMFEHADLAIAELKGLAPVR